MTSRWRDGRWPWALLKLLVALVVIGALFYFDMIRLGAVLALLARPRLVLVTLVVLLATVPLSAWRWQILLAAAGVRIAVRQAYHLCAIGMFTGVLLPGIVGGDAVRFFYLNAAVPQHRVVIALSLIADRLLGLIGLIAVTAVAVGIDWPIVQASPALLSIAVVVVVGSIAAVAAAALALHMIRRLHRAGWLDRLRSRWPTGLPLRVLEAMLLYWRLPVSVIAAVALSILIQALSVAAVVVVASEMRLDGLLGPSEYALAASLSLLANAVPLSPGGLGVGEAAFDQLCHWVAQSSQAGFGSAFFAFRGLSLLAAVIVAPSFLIYRPERRLGSASPPVRVHAVRADRVETQP
jgi:uncharacterized membrane protein YbhN (UPF0104 family)